ncbi:acid-sensing ion channel 4-like isoform X2 [Acanthaster planci]|uniref:Acid-sensing ion channel 4-like isoform X2 n=1 Tax=Acanthaster planci TaxID=133434 RepID=A0A8B7ZU91_ACAPL|nr:acid-sensing ion channel 4-like isoform X2 [Acanthaster planci]
MVMDAGYPARNAKPPILMKYRNSSTDDAHLNNSTCCGWSTVGSLHPSTNEEKVMTDPATPAGGKKGTPFGERLRGFGDATTFHGLRYVMNNSYSRSRRLLWLILVLGMTTFLVYNIFKAILVLLRHPETSAISLNYVPRITFPAVTVCNINLLRASSLDESVIGTLAAIYQEDRSDSTGFDFGPVDALYHYPNGSDSLETIFNASHQIEDMLFRCRWRHEKCSAANFTRRLTDHGVCYTFNDPADERDALQVQNPGSSNGLFMRLNIEQDLYTYGESTSAGIKVLLHPQGEFPIVKEFAFSLTPGFATSIAVRKQRVRSLRAPFKSNCTESNLREFPFKYSVAACHFECLVHFVVEHCGCRDYRWPVKAPICSVEKQVTCVYHYEDEFAWDSDKCSCPMSCETTTYESKISQAQWPAKHFDRDLQEKYNLSHQYLRDNYLDVYVFMEEIMFMEIEQQEAYTLEHFEGDIGGYMGLLCGMSLITLAEWVDFIIITIYKRFISSKRVRSRNDGNGK